MGGAEALTLHEGRGVGADTPHLFRDRLMVGSDDHGKRAALPLRRCSQHVGEQRLAGHGVQHLRLA